MRTAFNLKHVAELRELAGVLRVVHGAVDHDVERWLIVGATARDLVLHHLYGLPAGRRTEDLDIALAVETWAIFENVEQRLVAGGAERDPTARHRFRLLGWTMDVLPFSGVARDGVILWPPSNDTAMSVFGFDEASRNAFEVLLPGDVSAFVASPAGLLILKLMAWRDRHWERPHHDAVDLSALIRSYGEAWNEDRLYAEADDLLQRFGYDNALAGAALIGRDAATIASPDTLEQIHGIVRDELSAESMVLAGDMGGPAADNVALLEALLTGFDDDALSRR